MSRLRIIFLPLIVGVTCAFVGCGTTHHFLPPRPLEKGEAMISVSWHYDLGQLHLLDPLPDANFYFGAGKNYNVGFGMKVPMISVNHFTTAKYWAGDNGDYTSAFFHVNQILGPNNNPYLEIGGAYFKWKDSFNQSFVLGLGVGTGVVDPLLNFWSNPGNHRTFDSRLQLIPFAKYSAAGSDFGVSVNYYHGMSKTGADHLIEAFYQPNDSIMMIEAAMVDSICDPGEWTDYNRITSYIHLSTGDTVELRDYVEECGLYMMMHTPPPFFPWFDHEWYVRLGRFATDEIEYQLYREESNLELQVYTDVDELRARVERGEDIVFWRFSEDLNQRLLKRRETLRFWHDLSVGAAAISYEKSDD